MKIKRMFLIIYAVTGLAILGLAVSTVIMINTQSDLNQSQEIRYKSYQVADELRQNSDDLTRLARSYVVTGDEKFAREYWELVDISNGKKPRKDGRIATFTQLMKELNFAREEFDKIRESEDKSNALVATEEQAMNAVKGLFKDQNGNYTVHGAPDLELARKLLHDQTYLNYVETINQPINEFFDMLDHRTKGTVESFISTSYTNLYFIFGLIIVLLFIQILSYTIINKKVTKPIDILKDATVKVSHGDLSAKVDYNTNDEIGQLSGGFNKMVQNIKKGIDELADEKAGIQKKVDEAVKESEEQKKYLSRNVETLLKEMQRFSDGDLNISVQAERNDIVGELFNGFNKSVSNIREMLRSVKESVQATASAAAEISSSSEQMAAGSHEQSQQTSEVASAVEEMTKTIFESTKSATDAADNSKLASETAKEGYNKVEDTKKGMLKIVESTKSTGERITSLAKRTEQIGAITQVIDDIADQTNLLALNAAIEAARAGEQGRGFAVVADEVRKLAERTTKATKEIADTIKQIQSEAFEADRSMNEAGTAVENGMKLTEAVTVSLSKILETNQNVSDIVTQVAAASEQQSAAAEQISKNIEGISSVTQQAAAGTEQIARAAEDLNRLTVNLQELISRFKMNEQERTQNSHQFAYN